MTIILTVLIAGGAGLMVGLVVGGAMRAGKLADVYSAGVTNGIESASRQFREQIAGQAGQRDSGEPVVAYSEDRSVQ